MVERKPRSITESFGNTRRRVVDLFTKRIRKEKQGFEALHPLVKDHGIFAHAHNNPDQDANTEVLENGVVIVADGVGSTQGGGIAAQLACETIAAAWRKAKPDKKISLDTARFLMQESILKAHAAIVEEAAADLKKSRMSTTVVAAKLWEGPSGEKKAILGWVGDSKGAILRTDGTLEQVTIDDDLASYFLDDPDQILALQRKLSNATSYDQLDTKPVVKFEQPIDFHVYRDGRVEADTVDQLTSQDFFAGRNIVSQSLGGKLDIIINIAVRDVSSGDIIVLSTDGESDNNTHDEREAILRTPGTAMEKAQRLGEAAVARSSEPRSPSHNRPKHDDTRVTVVEIA